MTSVTSATKAKAASVSEPGNQKPRRGEVRDRILRVLLNNPTGKISTYRIALKAKSTYPWTRELLHKLADKKLIEGTKVIDYPRLYDYWKSVTPKKRYREYMVKDPIGVLKKISLCYALTTYQAENIIQGYLFPSRTDVYVQAQEKEDWHKLLTKKGMVGGGNTRLIPADESLFYNSTEKKGLKIVSAPQLIVDLLIEGGPCSEAAKMLIEGMQKDV